MKMEILGLALIVAGFSLTVMADRKREKDRLSAVDKMVENKKMEAATTWNEVRDKTIANQKRLEAINPSEPKYADKARALADRIEDDAGEHGMVLILTQALRAAYEDGHKQGQQDKIETTFGIAPARSDLDNGVGFVQNAKGICDSIAAEIKATGVEPK